MSQEMMELISNAGLQIAGQAVEPLQTDVNQWVNEMISRTAMLGEAIMTSATDANLKCQYVHQDANDHQEIERNR